MEDREEKRKEGVCREKEWRAVGDRRKYVGKEDNQREKLKWETIRSRREDRNRRKNTKTRRGKHVWITIKPHLH